MLEGGRADGTKNMLINMKANVLSSIYFYGMLLRKILVILFGFTGCQTVITFGYSHPLTSRGHSAQRLLLPPGPGHVFISGYSLQQGAH